MVQVKQRYGLETLKDLPTFRAYRDFFWNVGIDPTKNRPAAEALIRRTLRGKTLPTINTFVDAYNLASMNTEIALAAFDSDKLRGDLHMRFAQKSDQFLGIGMHKPLELMGGEVVISDAAQVIAVYPYRDADHSKITKTTEAVLLLTCGVPGIHKEKLKEAAQITLQYVTKFCGGKLHTSLLL